MKQVLILQSSSAGPTSISRNLTEEFLVKYKQKRGEARFVSRDLVATLLPHLSTGFVEAMFVPPDQRTTEMNSALSLGLELAEELKASDDIIISAPMHNRTVPSSLKAWIDHVVLPFVTFRYGPNGQEGLLQGKTVYFISASGGVFSHGPQMEIDFFAPYIRHIMGFMGITDVRIIQAEGVAWDREKGIQLARAAIESALMGAPARASTP
jgi:FMN-dependent NADH-azoreductase